MNKIDTVGNPVKLYKKAAVEEHKLWKHDGNDEKKQNRREGIGEKQLSEPGNEFRKSHHTVVFGADDRAEKQKADEYGIFYFANGAFEFVVIHSGISAERPVPEVGQKSSVGKGKVNIKKKFQRMGNRKLKRKRKRNGYGRERLGTPFFIELFKKREQKIELHYQYDEIKMRVHISGKNAFYKI